MIIDVGLVLYLKRIVVVIEEFQAFSHVRQSNAPLFLIGFLSLGVATDEVELVAPHLCLHLDKRIVLIADAMLKGILDEGDEHEGWYQPVGSL